MNNGKERVKLSKVIQKMNLVNLTPQIDVSGIWQVIFHVLYFAGV